MEMCAGRYFQGDRIMQYTVNIQNHNYAYDIEVEAKNAKEAYNKTLEENTKLQQEIADNFNCSSYAITEVSKTTAKGNITSTRFVLNVNPKIPTCHDKKQCNFSRPQKNEYSGARAWNLCAEKYVDRTCLKCGKIQRKGMYNELYDLRAPTILYFDQND